MKKETTDVQQLIDKGETLRSEFKPARAHPDALASALVSFLNTEGGVLLIGVEDDGAISGVENPDTASQRIDQILTNNITPRATAYIEPVPVQGQTIVKVTVPRGVDRPYQTRQGQCFLRMNAGKRLASREEMRRMYLAVRSVYYDETTLIQTGINNLDLQIVDEFLNVVFGYARDESRPQTEYWRLLQNLKAMQGDEVTVAGMLLFAKRPQTSLPTASIDFARIDGTSIGETFLDRKTIEGRIPQQVEGIEELLRLYLKQRGHIKAFEPEIRYEMPLEMLREVVINALVHRDYSMSSTIRVFMFDDRLEAHSPGRLPNSVTIDNIRAGIHVERNPVILSLMAKLGFMTRLGTGILRIFRLAQEAGLPEPALVENDTEFVVTIYRDQ
jgi:ATP-dependent DNA helicase RecG